MTTENTTIVFEKGIGAWGRRERPAGRMIDFGGAFVLLGLIDVHVHTATAERPCGKLRTFVLFDAGDTMLIRRLTWAGLEIQTPATIAVVDLLTGTPALSAVAGRPREPLLAPLAAPGTVDVAAVTHLHSDHFDMEALRLALAPGAPVLCPQDAAQAVAEAGLEAQGVEL